MNTEHCIEVCNRLLRGERSALNTYEKAIEKHGAQPISVELTRLRSEHASAVAALEESVRSMGGTPDLEAGAWGSFTETVQSTANLLGSNASLEALHTGERAGKSDYEAALADEDVMPHAKELIRTTLLPSTERHISELEGLQRVA